MPDVTITVSGPDASAYAEVVATALLAANVPVALDPAHGPILPERHRRMYLETLPRQTVRIKEQPSPDYEAIAKRGGWQRNVYGSGWHRLATKEELKKYPGGDQYAHERTAKEAVERDHLI